MATQLHFPTPAPMPAVARILSSYDRAKVEAFVEVAIGLLDTLDGDGEAEDGDPPEANGEESDVSFVEWHTMRGSEKRGPNIASENDDDEEDDPAEDSDEDRCQAADDGLTPIWVLGRMHYGSADEAGELNPAPAYGEDQSKGPIGAWCG